MNSRVEIFSIAVAIADIKKVARDYESPAPRCGGKWRGVSCDYTKQPQCPLSGFDSFSIFEELKGRPVPSDTAIIAVTVKELWAIEWQRLDGKIKSLWQKGSFSLSDLVQDIKGAVPEEAPE